MGERVVKVENFMKEYQKQIEKIESKVNEKEKNQLKEMEKQLKEIEKQINSPEVKKHQLHIDRLQEELSEVDPYNKELIEEYKNKIEEEIKEFNQEELLNQKQELMTKKQELLENMKENETVSKKQVEQDKETQKDNLIGLLTQEKIAIEKDMQKLDLEMKQNRLETEVFQYEYEEKDGVKIPTNGDQFKALNDKYSELATKKKDLEKAKSLCENKLEQFKLENLEKDKKIFEAWKEALRNGKNNKIIKQDDKQVNEVEINKEKFDKIKQEMEIANRDYKNIDLNIIPNTPKQVNFGKSDVTPKNDVVAPLSKNEITKRGMQRDEAYEKYLED